MLKVALALLEMARSQKVELNRLDGAQGDGDLGVTAELMAEAFYEVCKDYSDLQTILLRGGESIRRKAPSTIGILISSALIAAGRSNVSDGSQEDIYLHIQEVMIDEIQRRGQARPGDRTILDAFVPAFEEYRNQVQRGMSPVSALQHAVVVAEKSARATREMIPKTGRAAWLPSRAAGEVDGGAWLCYLVYRTIYESLSRE